MISRKSILSALAVVILFAGAGVVSWQLLSNRSGAPASAGEATFAGSEVCAGCHQVENKLWHSSQHERAMAHATDKSVLGDFNDASFQYFEVQSRFFRKDGNFFVETDGPDGKLATYQVKYTFGVDPLQQYLIEFPDGRLQALSIAWDSRPKDKGGQRWFHLYPNENIRHDDVLHWTKLNQNWNFMCAECHSTGVQKNYDAAADRFATKWAEISVGCEACHGAGSRHVAWAQDKKSWWPASKQEDRTKGLLVQFDERAGTTWTQNEKTGMPQRNGMPLGLRKEVETCGLCHARRAQFSEKWVPGQLLSNTHLPTPMYRNLSYADGQMRDVEELYNYLPFKESKMFAAGVTCSDCHDPHSATLRAPGDGVCLQCHTPAKYESVSHRHHENVSSAVSCVSCHMPERSYMVVDRRHDHSFRIPRPDLSVKLGTPNACNDCHRDQSAQWAATTIETWFGPRREGFQTYAAAFHAAWTQQPDAGRLLNEVVSDRNAPAVARASALIELGGYISPANFGLAQEALSDSDPMVRMAALEMLGRVPANQLWPLISPLLSDPIQGVRIRALALLAATLTASQPAADRERFDKAAAEFVAAQRLNADRPEARVTLANFLAQRGQTADAETEFKAARRLNPQFAPAAINLADLYRSLGREEEGVTVLRDAVSTNPQDASLRYALGLALVRQKKQSDALPELKRATELAPDQAHYAYVYAVGLHSAGQADDAIAVLKDNLAKHPTDRESLLALVTFNRDGGNIASALEYAQRLAQIAPNDRRIADLVETLRRQIDAAPR
ncbi:MAG: tetratricopeptide repeat protein [Pseudolabrys sp.]